jgi:hypothetical protein
MSDKNIELTYTRIKRFINAQKDSRRLNYISPINGKRISLGYHIGQHMTKYKRQISGVGFFSIYIASEGRYWMPKTYKIGFNIFVKDIYVGLILHYASTCRTYGQLKTLMKTIDKPN